MINYTQDMPPSGGFGEINYKAVPAKRWISNKKLAVAAIILLAYNHQIHRRSKRKLLYENICENDAKNALEPFFEAERDRNFLIQLRKNREIEKKIMKDVPGWVPGTFYGRPFFTSLNKDELIPESQSTFNMFSDNEWSRRAHPDRQFLSEFRITN